MSFRLFIYYCAVCGAWAAWLGWAVGRLLAPADEFPRALVHGLAVGLLVAPSLSLANAFGKRRAGSRESGVESQPLPALDPPPSALGSRSRRQPRDLVLGAL